MFHCLRGTYIASNSYDPISQQHWTVFKYNCIAEYTCCLYVFVVDLFFTFPLLNSTYFICFFFFLLWQLLIESIAWFNTHSNIRVFSANSTTYTTPSPSTLQLKPKQQQKSVDILALSSCTSERTMWTTWNEMSGRHFLSLSLCFMHVSCSACFEWHYSVCSIQICGRLHTYIWDWERLYSLLTGNRNVLLWLEKKKICKIITWYDYNVRRSQSTYSPSSSVSVNWSAQCT